MHDSCTTFSLNVASHNLYGTLKILARSDLLVRSKSCIMIRDEFVIYDVKLNEIDQSYD